MNVNIPLKIISGGQTGADRAGLDVAIKLGIPHGGFCPHGRKAEDGLIPEIYNLTEAQSGFYQARTELNVKWAMATLIFSKNLGKGSALTRDLCIKHKKPFMVLRGDPLDAQKVQAFTRDVSCEVLNVAGSRLSRDPTIYDRTYHVLLQAFEPKFTLLEASYGVEHIPVSEWVSCLKGNIITPDDGTGLWATEKSVSNWESFTTDKPTWATHVVWYSK